MKSAPFQFVAAESVEQAVALLGEDARVLAGGQSLLPLLNLRLARPQRLVDINQVASLARLRRSEGRLYIGATVQAEHAGTLLAGRAALAAVDADRPVCRKRRDPVARDRRRERRARRPERRAPRRVDGARRPLSPALGDGPPHVDGRRALHRPADDRHRRRRAARDDRGPAAAAGRALRVRRVRPDAGELPAGRRRRRHGGGHAAIALLGGGSHPLRAPAAERALLAGASAKEVAELAAGEISDPHRRALVAAVTREALEA